MNAMQTVVELPEFVRRAKATMSDEERAALIDAIAGNPGMGISLGGGLRKVRIARQGGGKSGGYRTIYVFGGTHIPIFSSPYLQKTSKIICKTEQADLIVLSKALLARYGER